MSAGTRGLWVVVLNYRGLDDTVTCVRSVLADGVEPEHVVVVDNGSDDGIEQELDAAALGVVFLQNGANLGFSGGMNRGLAHALAAGAEHVCVLNNDTVVLPGMFGRLVELAGPDVAVSPEVRYRDDVDTPWFGGGTVDERLCWPRHLTPDELAEMDASDPDGRVREAGTLAGCCVLADAGTWRGVGMFDPAYFLIFEDADWSARARERGVRLLVARDALLLHTVSASFSGPGRLLATYYYARNGLRFGRTRVTRRLAPRARFVRDLVIRPALRHARHRDLRGGTGELLFGLLGVQSALTGRTGAAPPTVDRWARRWAARTASRAPAGTASRTTVLTAHPDSIGTP